MPLNLSGRRILITGASSGIGEAAARQFAQVGAEVVIVSERDDDLHNVATSINQFGGKATAIVADFSKPEQVEGLFARAEEQIGTIDTLVNNAGLGLGASILETTPTKLRFLFEVNFFALWELSRQALAAMAPRRNGRIINVSSAAGRFGSPNVAAYSATKGAVHAFTQALRIEASAYNVHVSEVLPISVRTKFFEHVEGEKYKPRGVVLTTESVARSIVTCVASSRPKAEVLPFRPIGLWFGLDALAPGFTAWLSRREFTRTNEKK